MGRLDRAIRDLEEGRLWKARDRLQGIIGTLPLELDALDLLGHVYMTMGDLPKAGSVWALTGRDDARFQAAYDALVERYGGDPALILASLPIRAPIHEYPERARALVGALRERTEGRGALPRRTRTYLDSVLPAPSFVVRVRNAFWSLIAVFLVLAFFGALVAGLVLELHAANSGLASIGIDARYPIGMLGAAVLAWAAVRRIRATRGVHRTPRSRG